MLKKMMVLFLAMTLCLGLVACEDDAPLTQESSARVTFRYEPKGAIYEMLVLGEERIVEEPVTPFKEGYVFEGWYRDDVRLTFPYDIGDAEHAEIEGRWTKVPFTYVVRDQEVTITGYTGLDPDVVIPSEIDGYPVRRIGRQAFGSFMEVFLGRELIQDDVFLDDDVAIRSVHVPETVRSIGSFAFTVMTGLEEVRFMGESTLETIETFAFAYLPLLDSIRIPASVREMKQYNFRETGLNVIFAGASEQPEGWDEEWNLEGIPVTWDAPHEYEIVTLELILNSSEGDSTYRKYPGMPIDIPEPEKAGHVFDGWYVDEDLTVSFDLEVMPEENMTLYAKWRVYQPLIIYQNNVEIDDALSAYADAWGAENGVDVIVKTCGGDSCGYWDHIHYEMDSINPPDIFVTEPYGREHPYEDMFLGFDGDEEWIGKTDFTYEKGGTVYGFPVRAEGWGMAYNADLLDAAGVDPDTLVNVDAYRTAFEAIEAAELEGVDAPVSWTAAAGMYWTTGLHNFNGYLSSGLELDDRSVIEDLLNGVAHVDRLEALADWVEVLMDFTDPTLLTEGTYDDQINAFKLGEAVFIHQGNWIDPSLLDDGDIDFEVGYAPHASGLGDVDSIFVGAPSYYVINKDGDNVDLAKQFLNDMAMTEEGHEYMAEANIVPAFHDVNQWIEGPLSREVYQWIREGNIYKCWHNDMPPGFGMDELGPIYELYARGDIDKAEFVTYMKERIETLS
jgi:raffinose/stachyose/melibiose transport system substrate-binding protein